MVGISPWIVDEWVTQLLRQGFPGLQTPHANETANEERSAGKNNRQVNEMPLDSGTAMVQ
jgi:hypothetical protein